VLRWIWRLVLIVLGVPVLWLLAALGLATIPTGGSANTLGVETWVISNGHHATFVLPVEAAGIDWRDTFPPEHFPTEIRGYPFVGFGWGEREVYMNTPRIEDLDLVDGLRAILSLSTSVAHARYQSRPMEGPYARRLVLAPDRYRALTAYVREAFAQDANGGPVLIAGRGFSGTDAFYEGVGQYSFVMTCNEWIGRGLRRIAAPTGLWTPLAHSVLAHIR
jgi:uncharacterized protein (TIGR02117 family)